MAGARSLPRVVGAPLPDGLDEPDAGGMLETAPSEDTASGSALGVVALWSLASGVRSVRAAPSSSRAPPDGPSLRSGGGRSAAS
jgi:hypothetical protein